MTATDVVGTVATQATTNPTIPTITTYRRYTDAELLERLTLHADRNARLHAVLAMGQFEAPSILPALTRVVDTDSDNRVREAAAGVLLRRSKR